MTDLISSPVKVHGRRIDPAQTEILFDTRCNKRKVFTEMRESGQLAEAQKAVLRAFYEAPENSQLTYHVAAHFSGVSESCVTGRINELRNFGLVEAITDENGNVKRINKCTLYRITEKGIAAYESWR